MNQEDTSIILAMLATTVHNAKMAQISIKRGMLSLILTLNFLSTLNFNHLI